MNRDDFCERGARVLGGHGWKARLARATGRNRSTVNRWASGEEPVPGYAAAVVELLELVPADQWPARFARHSSSSLGSAPGSPG